MRGTTRWWLVHPVPNVKAWTGTEIGAAVRALDNLRHQLDYREGTHWMTVSGLIPQIRTTDLEESIEFYVSKLGFELEFKYSDFYAGIRVGTQSLHLKLADRKDPSIAFVAEEGHLHLYFLTDDVDGEAERLRRNGIFLQRDVANTPWGTREFSILDNQGHVLCFGQRAT